jgi:hypothetical protein
MLHTIIDYINNNKIVVLVIVIIFFYLYETKEYMTNITQEETKKDSLENYLGVNKKINLVTTINNKKYYLASIPKPKCIDMAFIVGGNCINNMLVLLEETQLIPIVKTYNDTIDDKNAKCNFDKKRLCLKSVTNEMKTQETKICQDIYPDCNVKSVNINEFYILDMSVDNDNKIYNILTAPNSYDSPTNNLFAINHYSSNLGKSDRVCVDLHEGIRTDSINLSIVDTTGTDGKLKFKLCFKEFETHENNKITPINYFLSKKDNNTCTLNKIKSYQVVLNTDGLNSDVLIFSPEISK